MARAASLSSCPSLFHRLPGSILALLFAVFLTACGGGGDGNDTSGSTTGSSAGSSGSSGSNTGGSGSTGSGAGTSSSPGSIAPPGNTSGAPAQPGTSSGASIPPDGTAAGDGTSTEPSWSIVELSALGTFNHPLDMNDAGVIVGMTTDPNRQPAASAIPYQDPFVLRNGQLSSLGSLGGTYGSANGINNAGQIAGYSYASSIGQTHAFLWENGTMRDIGALIGAGGSWAEGINALGDVVIYASDDKTYVYSNGSVRPIPGTRFLPKAINDAGQIVGTQLDSWSATFYDGGALVNLAPLVAKPYSLGTGLNNSGQLIGAGYSASSTSDYQGFLYKAGVLQPLTMSGAIQTYPMSINNAGDVVGWLETANHEWRGFLYRNGAMVDINTLPGIAKSGWTVQSAVKINNAGQILAGCDINGLSRTCLLTPPK